MVIQYFTKNLNYILKNKKIENDCWIFIFLAKKRHVHIAFERPLLSFENVDEISSGKNSVTHLHMK